MKAAAALLLVAALAGQPAPGPRRAPKRLGEYRVLTADFHIHMFPLDEATLAP